MKVPEYKIKKEDVNRLIRYATLVPSKAKTVSTFFLRISRMFSTGGYTPCPTETVKGGRG